MGIKVTSTIPGEAQTVIHVLRAANPETLQRIALRTGAGEQWLSSDFKGEVGDILPIYAGSQRHLLLGVGAAATFPDVQRGFKQLMIRWGKLCKAELVVDWSSGDAPENFEEAVEAAVSGLYQGSYQAGKYKSEKAAAAVTDAEVFMQTVAMYVPGSQYERCLLAVERSTVIAQTQLRIMDLVNAPANFLRPADLGSWVLASAKQYAYKAEAWGQEQIENAGMKALLAVNQGSAEPAAFIVSYYEPEAAGDYPLVALVGKGVTFDTGGISIKPSTNMHYMKTDMGGAAAVLGTLEAVARLKLPVRLAAIVPATENCVDARAVKPGDVIGSYAGKTIEVIDTDAEGRLILADALSYAVRQLKPSVVIDLATLTGSAVRTFGYAAAALFTNNDQLADQLYQAGWQCGERLWRLPLWDVYKDDIKSEVADLRNFSGKPTAGAISAAKFLEVFTDNHPSWAHLDIAGVAYAEGDGNGGKLASAYGIRLLIGYLEKMSRQ